MVQHLLAVQVDVLVHQESIGVKEYVSPLPYHALQASIKAQARVECAERTISQQEGQQLLAGPVQVDLLQVQVHLGAIVPQANTGIAEVATIVVQIPTVL